MDLEADALPIEPPRPHKLKLKLNRTVTTILQVGKSEEPTFSLEEDWERDFYTVVLDSGQKFDPASVNRLDLSFSGNMRTDELGLYLSSYTDHNGHTV